jgi:hypothetical protein
MLTVPRLSKVMRQVFEQDAPQLAREMGVIQRGRQLGRILALVLGWLPQPRAGSSALARFAGTLKVTISKQGLEAHWSFQTAEWLYALLLRAVGYLLSAKAVVIPLLQRFHGVYVEDGSSIVLPDALPRYWRGCGGREGQAGRLEASVKLTARLEVGQGTLQGPYLQAGRSHESSSLLQQRPLPTGALWIADLGYFALIRLAELSRRGCSF